MRLLLFSIIITFTTFTVFSQDNVVNKLRNETSRTIKKEVDSLHWNWKHGGLASLNLSQGSSSNWAAGGDNFSLALNTYFNYFLYYTHKRFSWDNNVDVNLGFVQASSIGSRKNDDRLDLISKYGYKVDSLGKWFLSGLFNFRSQFFDGYTYNNNSKGDFSSTFLSPAYILLSIGFDYRPSDKFSLFLSPVTSRWTILANKVLSQKGGYGIAPGSKSVSAFGAYSTLNYNNNFGKNVTYKGRLDLFSDYTNHPENINIFMTNQLSLRINKAVSVSYSLDMIYDDNIRIFGPNNKSAGLQLKSLIGIGYLRVINPKRY